MDGVVRAGIEDAPKASEETQSESPANAQSDAQQGETAILTDAGSLPDDPRLRGVLVSARDLLSELSALEIDCSADEVKGALCHVHDTVELLHKLAIEAVDPDG